MVQHSEYLVTKHLCTQEHPEPELANADFALAGALTADGIYGLPPGRQVQPILDYMAERGWHFVKSA